MRTSGNYGEGGDDDDGSAVIGGPWSVVCARSVSGPFGSWHRATGNLAVGQSGARAFCALAGSRLLLFFPLAGKHFTNTGKLGLRCGSRVSLASSSARRRRERRSARCRLRESVDHRRKTPVFHYLSANDETKTGRGFEPFAGPTTPSRSKISIIRAARG